MERTSLEELESLPRFTKFWGIKTVLRIFLLVVVVETTDLEVWMEFLLILRQIDMPT